MTSFFGNAPARRAFETALDSGSLHHAWLLVGPEGTGKASFARAAATLLLARAGEPGRSHHAFETDSRTAQLIAAGSHPDYRYLARLPRDAEKPEGERARSITIAQVRALLPMFATTPSLSPRRVIVIDAIDDLERAGANALLKSLEEPPAGTIFLLVSHAPGRLLPTIRSRCRLLRFEPLRDDEMRDALRMLLPEASGEEVTALAAIGGGAPGRALRYAGLDVAGIDRSLAEIARGDPSNAARASLARTLSVKAAQPRYEVFLDRAQAFIATIAPTRIGEDRRIALEAYDRARELAAAARGLSLDTQGTVFEMAGLVARLGARA